MSSLAPSVASNHYAPNKTPRILACVLCQHRKIKCDRSFPCSNCIKANVSCTPSTPAPARKRRRPNQDLQERLARCEELLKEYSTEGKPPEDGDTPTSKSPSCTPQFIPNQGNAPIGNGEAVGISPFQSRGKLVHEDGAVRFIDSYLLGTIHDELKAMREIIDNDETSPEDDASDSLTPDTNADLLLGGETPAATGSTVELQPSPGHVFRLWQIFLDRVNPLLKIIHVPTMQPYLVEAASGSPNLPRNIEALLFSIYALAVVALSEEECQAMLGYPRDAALQRFSAGVRTSLLRMGFLKTHDLTTLQALLLYLISLQGRYNRHAAWILNGVVIRIAQKMGLHRDGEALGLSPFEAEMRRRLWWQIVGLDAKYGIFSGLGSSLIPRGWDSKPPKNVNDADLHPSATEPFQDRDGPTEMIFVLLMNKVSEFMANMPVIEPILLFSWFDTSKIPGAPSKEQLAKFRASFEGLCQSLLDLLDQYCDPAAGPLHEYAIDFKTLIEAKFHDFFNPPREDLLDVCGPGGPTQKDHFFQLSVQGIEHAAQNYTYAQRSGFLWYTRLQFQIDHPIFLAGQLRLRPTGTLVDRAWKAMEANFCFHPELFQLGASKETMLLATALVKAWTNREKYHLQNLGTQIPTPEFIVRLRSDIPPEYLKEDTPLLSPPNPRGVGGSNIVNHSGTGTGTGDGGRSGAEPLKPEPMVADMDPSFDDFMGNYLDTDWDMFTGMDQPSSAAMTVPANTVATANAAPGNPLGHGNQINHYGSQNQIPTIAFGAFGLGMGPSTEW